MKTRFRGTVAAALMATGPLVALAQATPDTPAHPASATAARPGTYKSAVEGHRRFEDQKVQSWREANDKVGRIGGWQAYAREAAGEEASPRPAGDPGQHTPGPAPVKTPAPLPPRPASMPHDAHRGHGGHSMHEKP